MEEPKTVICVDFGMTGSVARWRVGGSEWVSKRSKTPTKVAYGIQGNIAAWGEHCEATSSNRVEEHFKAGISNVITKSGAVVRSSIAVEALGHTRGYLTAFCANVIREIKERKGGGWKDFQVIWYFTVPGSWDQSPTIGDFKQVAEDAVERNFDNPSKVRVYCDQNTTEANASALFLLTNSPIADRKCATGHILISCDIGGATVDVAVSRVSGAGILQCLPQTTEKPVGITAIEKAMWRHIYDTLQKAGVTQEPDKLALKIVRSKAAVTALQDFTGQGLVAIEIGNDIPDWPLIHDPDFPVDATTIRGGDLCIQGGIFKAFFNEFMSKINDAIGEGIAKAMALGQFAIIGFCGGGSRVPYLIERLRRTHESDCIEILTQECGRNPPEMATIIGASLLWDRTELAGFVRDTRFGMMVERGVEWVEPRENQASRIITAHHNSHPTNDRPGTVDICKRQAIHCQILFQVFPQLPVEISPTLLYCSIVSQQKSSNLDGGGRLERREERRAIAQQALHDYLGDRRRLGRSIFGSVGDHESEDSL